MAALEKSPTAWKSDDDDVYLYRNYNERESQNLYPIRFHTDQPKRHKYKKYLEEY
jgi:hypothetical protein